MAEFTQHPFLLSAEETARTLQTDMDKGLTTAQINELQQKYPKNEFDVGKTIAWYSILTKQILNAMIIVGDHKVAEYTPPADCFTRFSCLPWRSVLASVTTLKVVYWHSSFFSMLRLGSGRSIVLRSAWTPYALSRRPVPWYFEMAKLRLFPSKARSFKH